MNINNWIISKKIIPDQDFEFIKNYGNFHIGVSNLDNIRIIKEDFWIFVEGYVLPGFDNFANYKCLSQFELIEHLFLKYQTGFIHHLKGSFNIIIYYNNSIYVFNDHHALNKFFFCHDDNDLTLSNNINLILSQHKPQIDYNNIAIFELFEHFVEGYTLFKNVSYSAPGTCFTINTYENFHSRNIYFNPKEIFGNISENLMSIDEFSQFWETLIHQYIEYLRPNKISLTLTGGNDSRMILASLLKRNTEVNLFSFGNPESFDTIISESIASLTGLNYHNYYLVRESKTYSDYVNKLLPIGNSLVNFHRAHRLHAVEQETNTNPETDMIFAGFMGGDYVKGLSYDDYITPRYLREWEFGKQAGSFNDITGKLLGLSFLNDSLIDRPLLDDCINTMPFFNSKVMKERQFNTLFHLIGSVHDWQDSYIFSKYVKYVVNPFMDIDFLKILYSSPFSFFRINKKSGPKFLRHNRSSLHVGITDSLAPQLSGIVYAKSGFYSANEYLHDNPYLLASKRFKRLHINNSYSANFQYDEWFKPFILEKLKETEDLYPNIFKIREMSEFVSSNIQWPQTEKQLHRITNPINILLNLKVLLK